MTYNIIFHPLADVSLTKTDNPARLIVRTKWRGHKQQHGQPPFSRAIMNHMTQ